MPMRLYENIRTLRIEKGLTQDELATMVGYKSRASITHVENGDINLSQQKIIEFAKALEVSPIDLVGWSEEHGVALSKEERQLIHRFRHLNKKGRETAMQRIEELTMIPKYAKMMDA